MNNKNDTLLEAATKILTGQIQESPISRIDWKNGQKRYGKNNVYAYISNGKYCVGINGTSFHHCTDNKSEAEKYLRKLDSLNIKKESSLEENVSGFSHPDVTQKMLDAISEFDAEDVERLLQWMIEAWSDTGYENSDTRKLISNLKTTHRIWKNRSSN
jgi:hypothetical protein